MPLAVGATAPDFTLPDQDGNLVTLSALLATGPVALFFYPAVETPGCTKEACAFRNLAAEFAAAGVHRVGISRDSVAKQAKFATNQQLDYPLLSDADGAVGKAFGVKGVLFGITGAQQRNTFAIRADGTIAEVVEGLFKTDEHADRALAALR